jgi:hypothetical protein
MPKFKDNEGREYTLSLNYGKAVKIEDELGVPILSKPEECDYGIRNCVSMAYLMCEDQIQGYGLSPTDFGSSFDVEILGDLCNAVMESVVLFIKGQNPEAAMLISLRMHLAGGMADLMLDNMKSLQESGFFESPDSWVSTLTGEASGSLDKCFMDAFQKASEQRETVGEEVMEQLRLLLTQSGNSKR